MLLDSDGGIRRGRQAVHHRRTVRKAGGKCRRAGSRSVECHPGARRRCCDGRCPLGPGIYWSVLAFQQGIALSKTYSEFLCADLTFCCVQAGLCSSVAFERHSLALVEAEAALYWVIYAPSAYLTFPISIERAKSCLKSMNNLFRLMYRSLTSVIRAQGYLAARGALKDFLNAFMPGFCKQEGWCTLHDLYTPMTTHRGLPFIPLKDPGFQGTATALHTT